MLAWCSHLCPQSCELSPPLLGTPPFLSTASTDDRACDILTVGLLGLQVLLREFRSKQQGVTGAATAVQEAEQAGHL